MQNFKKLLFLLKPKEKKSALLLLVMIIFMGFMEIAGVLSIMPFILVVSNPEVIETNILLKNTYEFSSYFGVETKNHFLIFLGIVVFIVLTFSLSFKALTVYAQIKFSTMRELSISKRLIERYLHQPYSWFLNRNSSEIGKNILLEVSFVVGNGLKPFIELISQSIIVILLISMLIIIDPKISIIIAASFIIFYGLIYKFSKNFLDRIGKERSILNTIKFNTVAEAFGAAKEVKTGRLEDTYVKRFLIVATPLAKHQASSSIVSSIPRYALEIFTFGGIILLILYFLSLNQNFNTIIPIISLYAFAGYRLMPALQKIFTAITQLRYLGPGLDSLYQDIKSLEPFKRAHVDKYLLEPKKYIALKNIDFNYLNETKKTLDKINFKISVNKMVGIVGATGSGKTTTVDIILGLLDPEKGTLEIDDKIIDKYNKRAWQSSIGYVPQQIYLTDDTIASNIAFGIDPRFINYENVERAAKIANIHNFIIDDLPLKYNTVVGERGVRLSGGQRQRIGIARAFYNDPKVLILDEATNSLDSYTEKLVLDAISNVIHKITIIIITHRLNTLKECDKIILINKGKVVAENSYDELSKNSENFKLMLSSLSKNKT
ncbi:ABC transporter ATP-binding protein/permease [Candidatus Pelagibacter ubique]|nr:ABC transporter ATP-binding protein/permease [Candidatus Pelagibacter ubique]